VRTIFVRTGAAAVAAAALALLSGCGGHGASDAPRQAPHKSTKTLKVALTDAGCLPANLTAPAGRVTFAVTNGGTSSVSELEVKNPNGVIIGQRENIVAGLSASFTVHVTPGRYVLNCPNGKSSDNGVLVVTGGSAGTPAHKPATGALALKATNGYRTYVESQTAQLLAGTRVFVAALRRGDLADAKRLYARVRFHYEAVEPVSEYFSALDSAIDARINDVQNPRNWTGFHRIEQILWVKHTTRGTAAYGRKLLADVTTLHRKARRLQFAVPQLALGAVALMKEIANSKITGEEDRYSHTDLSDFAGNLEGAEQVFRLLRPELLRRKNEPLIAEIAAGFAGVHRGLDVYRRHTAFGFAPYGEITLADRQRLSQQVLRLVEPLSSLGGIA
jgi:iron uptake system component EfeO